MEATPDRFRRLARSGPSRWRALVLEGTWGPRVAPVRVRVEQPDLPRVERLGGRVLFSGRQGSVAGGAVLDPYELSEGVDVLGVRAVDHFGRATWEAVLRPTPGYSPRCGCCPLLLTADIDRAEGLDLQSGYAEADRIRLDVGTGICVPAREVGGPADGERHELGVSPVGW